MVDLVDNHLYEKQVFSVYDEKLGLFLNPFFLKNAEEAKRTLYDFVAYGNDSMLSRHPEDFKLYLLASYDESKGSFVPYDVPQYICCIDDVINIINSKRSLSEVCSCDDAPVSVKENSLSK